MVFGIMLSLSIIGGALIFGIFIIALGQLLLATREIALNTRTQEKRGTYKTLEILSYIVSFSGIFIIIIGLLIGIPGLIGSFSTSEEATKLDNLLKSYESELEQTRKKVEKISPPYIVITKPADLHRDDFRTGWPVGKIPTGTKLKMLDDHIYRNPSLNLKTIFYRVKYKGVSGWVIEDKCKLVAQ